MHADACSTPHATRTRHTLPQSPTKMADDTDEEYRDTDKDDSKPSAVGGSGQHHNRVSIEVFGPGRRTTESPADMLRGLHNNNDVGSELGRSFQTTSDGTVRSTDGSPSVAFTRNIAEDRPSGWQSGNFNISDVAVATLNPTNRAERARASGQRGLSTTHSKKCADDPTKSEHAVNNYKHAKGALLKGSKQAMDEKRLEKYGETTGEEVQIADGPFRCGPWKGIMFTGRWNEPKPTNLACRCQPIFSLDKAMMVAHLRKIDASTEKYGKFISQTILEPVKIEVNGKMEYAVCHKVSEYSEGLVGKRERCGLMYDQDGELVLGFSRTGQTKDCRYV